jgi:DNA ligase-associated metallophosphoesterase
MTTHTQTIRNQVLQLLGDRAIFWPAESALIISDPHFGKAASFRHSGIPVPHGTTPADLARLNMLLSETGARRLTILGDFFHHHTGQCERTMALLSDWRAAHADLVIELIIGNHDRHSAPPPAEWQIQVENRPAARGPFLLCHEPCRHENLYILSGHIHPAVRLTDSTGHGLTVPCFYFGEHHAMLPAFGSFTGTARIHPQPGDAVYAVIDGEIIPIPT